MSILKLIIETNSAAQTHLAPHLTWEWNFSNNISTWFPPAAHNAAVMILDELSFPKRNIINSYSRKNCLLFQIETEGKTQHFQEAIPMHVDA